MEHTEINVTQLRRDGVRDGKTVGNGRKEEASAIHKYM